MINQKKWNIPFSQSPSVRNQLTLATGDIIVFLAVFIIAHIVGGIFLPAQIESFLPSQFSAIIVELFLLFIMFYIFDLYDVKNYLRTTAHLLRIFFAIICALGLSALLLDFGRFIISRTAILIEAPFLIVFLYIWREIFSWNNHLFNRKTNVLFVGADTLNRHILEEINNDGLSEYAVVSVDCTVNDINDTDKNTQSIVVTREDLCGIINSRQVDIIVFSLQSLEEFGEDLIRLKAVGIEIFDELTFYKIITGKVPILNMESSIIACFSGRFPLSAYYRNLKRFIDIVLSLFGIAVSAPFMVMAAIAIVLESRGPVFFCPERIGENGHPITLYKFRTMVHLNDKNPGPLFTRVDDPRITQVGKILRATGFDEFPQLFNVLRGEMSLVGPRPIEEEYINRYVKATPLYFLRISMKPGISGWAQIMQSYYPNTDQDQMVKLQYDLYYITHASFFLDIVIILKTLKKFITLGSHDRRKPERPTHLKPFSSEKPKEFVSIR